MKRFAVIGCPIEHSLSPELYAGLFDELGIDAELTKLLIRPEELPFIRSITEGLDGFAVTMPHKRSIISYLDSLDPSAARCGAVNIVKRDGEELTGFNTDGRGLVNALADMGFDPDGASAAIYGRGGAALAAAHALRESGASVSLLVRSSAGEAQDGFPRLLFNEFSEKVDLFVNATPLGMAGASGFADFDFLSRLDPEFVFDMVYLRDGETELIKTARALGRRAESGYKMLRRQALLALSIWLGADCQ